MVGEGWSQNWALAVFRVSRQHSQIRGTHTHTLKSEWGRPIATQRRNGLIVSAGFWFVLFHNNILYNILYYTIYRVLTKICVAQARITSTPTENAPEYPRRALSLASEPTDRSCNTERSLQHARTRTRRHSSARTRGSTRRHIPPPNILYTHTRSRDAVCVCVCKRCDATTFTGVCACITSHSIQGERQEGYFIEDYWKRACIGSHIESHTRALSSKLAIVFIWFDQIGATFADTHCARLIRSIRVHSQPKLVAQRGAHIQTSNRLCQQKL